MKYTRVLVRFYYKCFVEIRESYHIIWWVDTVNKQKHHSSFCSSVWLCQLYGFLLQKNKKYILEKVCIKATMYLIKVKGKYL